MNYSYDSVKAKIKNKSRETGVNADMLYKRYFLERFIARIAASKHRDSVIIKGGMLLSAIAGIDMRTTKDLDTTIRGGGTVHDFENIVRDVIAVTLRAKLNLAFRRCSETKKSRCAACFTVCHCDNPL